jgi:hypothetical protein
VTRFARRGRDGVWLEVGVEAGVGVGVENGSGSGSHREHGGRAAREGASVHEVWRIRAKSAKQCSGVTAGSVSVSVGVGVGVGVGAWEWAWELVWVWEYERGSRVVWRWVKRE